MALYDTVSEDRWKAMGGGNEPGSYQTTFIRRVRFDPAATYPASAEIVEIAPGEKYVYLRKIATTQYLDEYTEVKQYALTEAACTNYIAANPTVILTYSRQDEFGTGFTLTKRVVEREITSYTLSDAPEAS